MTTERPSGSPIWIDYSSNDPETAKAFYSALLGWEFEDMGPEFGHYHMIRSGGNDVGGFMSMADAGAAMDDMGMEGAEAPPAAWSTYLETADLDATVARAAESGITPDVPAMDVGDLGRMAMVTAPDGAHLGLWQAKTYDGFTVEQGHGTPVWFECMSTDFDAAFPFYRDVLGWEATPMGPEDGGDQEDGTHYFTNGAGDSATAGLCDAAQWFERSLWRTYFAVPDCDAACAKVTELGGRVADGPMDTPFGRIATVIDPEGATFQLNQDL
ncbi:VOC family protein [Brevibacterium litoralis]|uniref:VOC family protein n=1 Tax=Brevibacterium litoralis TaxID=3138935 RepID=UPI0032EAFF25